MTASLAPQTGRTCEETSPLTGQRCRAAAVVVVERFGDTFGVCASCALLFQWKGKRIRGEARRQPDGRWLKTEG